jgi:hypothetical protein
LKAEAVTYFLEEISPGLCCWFKTEKLRGPSDDRPVMEKGGGYIY